MIVTVAADLPPMPTRKTMQMDASPPKGTKVIREIDYLKRDDRPDELFPFPFKDDGEVSTPELTKLLESI